MADVEQGVNWLMSLLEIVHGLDASLCYSSLDERQLLGTLHINLWPT